MDFYKVKHFVNADEFINEMLLYGTPLETSLVGAFQNSGRGSKRDIDLPFHRDGDYSTSFKGKIDIVGLYCINPGTAETHIKLPDNTIKKFVLKKHEAIIFNNHNCMHARFGPIEKRVLLRMWVSKYKT